MIGCPNNALPVPSRTPRILKVTNREETSSALMAPETNTFPQAMTRKSSKVCPSTINSVRLPMV